MEPKENITLSEQEAKEYQEYLKYKQEKEAREKRERSTMHYRELVDMLTREAVTQLSEVSAEMAAVKHAIYENFEEALKLKFELLGTSASEQYTHTFTSADGLCRLTLGNRTIDNYDDTAEDGIAMVKQYLNSLAKDPDSAALVQAVLKLLSKDAKGVIKASRVLQLAQMAAESKNQMFIDGVDLIQKAYRPILTKRFLKAETRDEKESTWTIIPLNMTEL